MSTSIAIATSSNAVAASALAQANRARKAACEGLMNTFDPNNATIETMKEYADCVYLLHPDPITDGESALIRVALTICFLGGIVGAAYAIKEDVMYSGHALNGVLGFLFGFVLTGVGAFILSLLLLAAKYVLGV